MPKEITLRQTGWYLKGTSRIHLWGGGYGNIKMDGRFIPLGQMTRDNFMRCINDGQYGCQDIDSAVVDVYVQYEGYREYDRTISVKNPDPNLWCRGIGFSVPQWYR